MYKNWIVLFSCFLSIIKAEISGELKVCALMVSFQVDDKESTTGNGRFLDEIEGIDCGNYHVDPPPHDRSYFSSQLKSVHNYFQSISYDQFGIDLNESQIYPLSDTSYELSQEMSYYYPYNQEDIAEDRLVELFIESIEKAYLNDGVDYSNYDLIIIFHAGIGQDFSLPFLDPTPEDIPSTFIDPEMIKSSTGEDAITIGTNAIDKGIILPETQNHLNYDISNSMFSNESDPCDYQYGLSGTLSLMIGFAVRLPPLWDIESGSSRIGVFGLMDQGSNNGRGLVPSAPDPWTRIHAGWEVPTIIDNNSEISLPKVSKNNIARVNINESEYFLIENRVNHFRKGVSLDSIRFKMWEETDTYPSFITILKDSVEVEQDDNGVITKIPNYDIGLPGSGLLIWHVDDNRIQQGIDDYSINKLVSRPGIDLEEADGAQDIGQQSFFMFNDPSSGYFGDMWFAENEEHYRANPQNRGSLPSFSDVTYPNTNSNNGSNSHISIENIGVAGDTVTFNVVNDLKPFGFSDSSAFHRVLFQSSDLADILIGGLDSLWFKNDMNAYRNYFHGISSGEVVIGLNRSESISIIEIFEYFDNSVDVTSYEIDEGNDDIIFRSNTTIDSIVYPVYYDNFQQKLLLNKQAWIDHCESVFTEDFTYSINEASGINNFHSQNGLIALNGIFPNYILGVDLDLDAIPDLIVKDSSNILTAYNYQLKKLSSFPADYAISGIVLAKNILGDNHPEIVTKSMDSSAINIFDHKGNLVSTITTAKNDDLVLIANIDQRNCIITRFNIFQLDDAIDSKGNEWLAEHGDFSNTRRLDSRYVATNPNEEVVSNAYCYPNPIKTASGTIRIETNDPSFIELNIYDASGYFIRRYTTDVVSSGFSITEWEFDTDNLESGIYFARLEAKVNSTSQKSDHSQLIKIAVIK